MRACAFFSPSLDPVLDGRKRDKDAVVAPEMPTRGPVGQAVFDHQPHRQINHAVGVLTAGWCEIGEVRIEVLATLGAVMLRIGDHEISRTPQVEITQVVDGSMRLLVPIGHMPTTRTHVPLVITAVGNNLWLGQVGSGSNAFAGIGSIRTRTEHGCVLLARILGPAFYDTCPAGAIPKPGKDAIVSFSARRRETARLVAPRPRSSSPSAPPLQAAPRAIRSR